MTNFLNARKTRGIGPPTMRAETLFAHFLHEHNVPIMQGHCFEPCFRTAKLVRNTTVVGRKVYNIIKVSFYSFCFLQISVANAMYDVFQSLFENLLVNFHFFLTNSENLLV